MESPITLRATAFLSKTVIRKFWDVGLRMIRSEKLRKQEVGSSLNAAVSPFRGSDNIPTMLRAGLIVFLALLIAAAESRRALVDDFFFNFDEQPWDFCEGEFRDSKVH
jgi:hypothetical protein